MPRASRYYLPGYVWHITHRCHKGEFLLKFSRNRRRLLQWLFEAKKRFGISILNYTVTSNHIHLVLKDCKKRNMIPATIQLVAGRTGQEYNKRKNRKGAFWEDRYHATAVEADFHLMQCMIYIDLNMVRAGVVSHPSEWPFCGYNEIQNPRQRYSLIDYASLIEIFGFQSMDEFKKAYREWVEEALKKDGQREPRWSESIAIGGEAFVREAKEKLGGKSLWREIIGADGSFELRECAAVYKPNLGMENAHLRSKNAFYWDDSA